MPISPSHLHKKCHTIINLLPGLGRLAPGDSALRAPRNGSCVRRERWARRNFRAGARGGSGCRRSSAHFGPIPLPPTLAAALGVGPSHLHKKCHIIINLLPGLGRLAPGDSALRALRNGSCVRRERWARRNFRAGARGEAGCRRSSAHFGPIPLPPKVPAVKMLTFMPEAAVHRLRG